MRTIVHINRQLLAKNRADGGHRPIYSVRRGRRGAVTYAHSVHMVGTVILVDPRTAGTLPCGATVWAEVEGDVRLVDPVPFITIEVDARAAPAAA